MIESEPTADRVREYLGRLTSQARSRLLVEIERIQLYGEDIPASATILAQLRAEFRKGGEPGDRVGNPSRYFFKPIEELFVDRSPERANSGEISRGSLSAIWEWINHVLLPTMARDYCDRVKHAIAINDPRQATQIAAGFQSKVVKCLEGFIGSDEGAEAARSGLGQYTSSRASLDDLRKILAALRVRDAIVAFNNALPPKLDNLQGQSLAKARGLLDAFAAKHPEAIPFALTILAKRLKTPWQLIHLATEVARSKSAQDIAATRYAITVSMVLDHLDDRRITFNHALKSRRVGISKDILTGIYDIEHELRARIERLGETDWGRRLDDAMAAVASDLKNELQSLPEDTHHVLASRSLHRHHSAKRLLTSLVQKGRDLVGLAHRAAG
jgi:hypothetical protein